MMRNGNYLQIKFCIVSRTTLQCVASAFQVAELLLVHVVAQAGSKRDTDSKILFDKQFIILSKDFHSLMMRLVHACSTCREACPRSEMW